MSGPYCEKCKHFYRNKIGNDDWGECMDPNKAIFDRNGNKVNTEPEVHIKYECHAWEESHE